MRLQKMSLVKVSVENFDTNEKVLYEVDISKSLEENISDICDIFQKPPSNSYGLKLLNTNDGTRRHLYISEDNFHEIKDGYFLKLVHSISYYCQTIFNYIDTDNYKEISFQNLLDLSVDPEFIKEMVKHEKHHTIVDVFTNRDLGALEATACLLCIVHLLQKQHISMINQNFINKIITTFKNNEDDEVIKYTLSVMHKILFENDPSFTTWKQQIIQQVSIADLTNFIRMKNSVDVQYAALLLINSLVRCCKGEKRQQLIKETDRKQCREAIYEHIILKMAKRHIDKNAAHELYVYQTHLLSVLSDTLTKFHTDVETSLREEFQPFDHEINRQTRLMEFHEISQKNKSASVENMLELKDDVRISLASMSSRNSELSSRYSSRNQSTDFENMQFSLLTIEALRHYKKYHYENFKQTQIEEAVYEPGILPSSERIVQMLAKILHIGRDPDRSSICYQPSIFNCSSKTPFFFELFSRTMWLLSKTRREMKASTLCDYDKVIRVLEKQVKLVLDEKPLDLKAITAKFANTSYDTVQKIWQKEKEQEMKTLLKEHECIKPLKTRSWQENEEIVRRQRLHYIKTGTLFPKIVDKKINGNFYAKLSSNNRELLINDYNIATKTLGETAVYSLKDVKYIIVGKACLHVQNNVVKDPKVAFSLLFDNNVQIHFKAADAKMAAYWLDALNMLKGCEPRSTYFTKEMEELVQMDLVLHLLELQDVTIPKKPPPIPQDPFTTKPELPPKPNSKIIK